MEAWDNTRVYLLLVLGEITLEQEPRFERSD